jgi:chromosome segregation ATPase
VENKEFEVNSIAYDTYQYFVQLHNNTTTQIEQVDAAIKSTEDEINALTQQAAAKKTILANLKVQRDTLQQKSLDVKDTIAELENHKANLKNIITKQR